MDWKLDISLERQYHYGRNDSIFSEFRIVWSRLEAEDFKQFNRRWSCSMLLPTNLCINTNTNATSLDIPIYCHWREGEMRWDTLRSPVKSITDSPDKTLERRPSGFSEPAELTNRDIICISGGTILTWSCIFKYTQNLVDTTSFLRDIFHLNLTFIARCLNRSVCHECCRFQQQLNDGIIGQSSQICRCRWPIS